MSKNIFKTWLLFLSFFVFVIFIGLIFARVFNNASILYFAVGLSLIMNFVSYWFSDKIALMLSGAKAAEKKDFPDLFNSVEKVANLASIPMPRVYVISDQSPNAFATGRNKKHAAVAVTSGIMQTLSREELEGVLAHEISHIKNYDILVSSAAVVLAGVVAMLSNMFLRVSFFGSGSNDRENSGLWRILGVVAAILAPIAAMLIQLAISRRREFFADESAARLVGDSRSLVGALVKIHDHPKQLKNASTATAHLYIDNPFKKKGGSWFIGLFMTHPPLEKRIQALKTLKL